MKQRIHVIFGKRSNLSLSLSSTLENAVLLSGGNAKSLLEYIDKDVEINVVINSFQRSNNLHDVSNPEEYVEKTLGDLSNIISVLVKIRELVGTVIYTSSASVYGESSHCLESDKVQPNSLYASLKVASELMIQNYLSACKVNYIIARVFNMYGGSDNFSIVSKVVTSCVEGKDLNLFNEGKSIRDFIYVMDVCSIYKDLLLSNYCGIVNVGTGIGQSVHSVLNSLEGCLTGFKINSKHANEISKSVASTDLLISIVGEFAFMDVCDYVSNRVR